jgi:preprotein translocase subunit SecE
MTMEQASDITNEPENSGIQARGEDARGEDVRGEGRALGLTRWVQYVFVLLAAFLFWFLDKAVTLIWLNFAEPNELVVSTGAFVVAAFTAYQLHRNVGVHRVAAEIVGELAKVSWPSTKETRVSTIIVIITSLIFAAVVGGFDFVWSAITDLLYKYKV